MGVYVLERADPRNLSVNVASSSGRVYRWGPDEKDAENIPRGARITTQMPGGFGTFDCSLTRRPDLSYGDLDRFAPTTVTGGAGALTAFDGYLASAPMDRGDSYSFSPAAIGWSGHLKDDTSASMVYIDRQISKWGNTSATEELNIANLGYGIDAFANSVQMDAGGNPCLQLSLTAPVSAGTGGWAQGEVLYDAGAGNLIRYLGHSGITALTATTFAANWQINIEAIPADHFYPSGTASGFNPASGAAAVNDFTAGAGSPGTYRWIAIQAWVNAAGAGAAAAGNAFGWQIKNPFLIGDHGLTLRAGPSGGTAAVDSGFYGGDVVADIAARWAPKLSIARGASGAVVWNDAFVVPHLVFNTPTTADAMLQAVNQYYLYDYGVYENRSLFWRPSGSGATWHLRVGDGVKVTDQGPQIETAFNGVVVQYTDPAGAQRYVGPPPNSWDKDPVSSAVNSSSLQDTSATNICNQYGRKRWAFVQMGTTTWQGAVAVGQIFLATAGRRPTSGTATVTGFARDSNGRDWPAWMIRAGDTVVLDDTNDQTPRYVLSTDYSHDSLANTLTLDAPPNKLDWLLARLGLVISAIG